jgi:hypothetical protein
LSGSGDGRFPMVEEAIRQAFKKKRGLDRQDVPAEPAKPPPSPKRGVRKVHLAAGGMPDLIDDHDVLDVSHPRTPQPRVRDRATEWVDGSSVGEERRINRWRKPRSKVGAAAGRRAGVATFRSSAFGVAFVPPENRVGFLM